MTDPYEKIAAKVIIGLLAVLFFVTTAHGAIPTGKVVGITDGDTITVLGPGNVQRRIRLAGIDAPEHNQAFGYRSNQHLSRLLFGKMVTLDCGNQESYGRLVCKVLLPDGEDACLNQIQAGLAWHYKQFESEQSPLDRKAYAAAEEATREFPYRSLESAQPDTTMGLQASHAQASLFRHVRPPYRLQQSLSRNGQREPQPHL